MLKLRMPILVLFMGLTCFAQNTSSGNNLSMLLPHRLSLPNGRTITLSLPTPFEIGVAATGMHRVRFIAASPDGRLFVTDMSSLADNTRGAIYILGGWNSATHTFASRVTYLDHLRNPNNVAFYTDPAGQSWLYTAFTDRLVRYKYKAGDNSPTGPPEVLARYPDYGLNYKYGGWHLTRTIAFANLHGKSRLYVTVGSSCNACREKEPIRATLSVMDPDGGHPQVLATGLRNAVGLEFIPSIDNGALFATNMGADHLGDQAPEDSFLELDSNRKPTRPGANYGWPTCYFKDGISHPDPSISHPDPNAPIFPPPPAGPPPPQFDCAQVPRPVTTFLAHSSPLGFAYFDAAHPVLNLSFLVALHGASHPHIGTGYRVVRFTVASPRPQNFITGFLANGKVKGRPCGILPTAPDAFLLTDDANGVIYAIHPKT